MKSCNGVVVVARENFTTFDMLDTTMADISAADAKLLGVILLDSSDQQKKYGYYNSKYGYKRGYGYRHGYGYKYRYRYNYKYADDPQEADEKQK